MSLLEIENIDVYYGDVQVIFDLSITIEKGTVVSIIGGNGAGKSTLLRTVSGLMSARKGKITFDGQAVQTATAAEIVTKGIIHVPEGRRLFPLMSVKDNLLVGAYNHRARGDLENTLQDVYKLLPRLAERHNQQAISLSGGEQQLVAIG